MAFRLGAPPVWSALGVLIALGLLCVVVFALARQPTDDWTQGLAEEVSRLSVPDATLAAETILRDPEQYDIMEVDGSPGPGVALLSQQLQHFFQTFPRVAAINYPTELNIATIEESRAGYVRLGTGSDHTEIVAPPQDDEVLVVADDVPADRAIEGRFPSVYHYIVYTDRLMNDPRL